MAATSQQGGTITYSSNTPTVCTVNAATGSVSLNGPGAGSCTIVATSSLSGTGGALANNSTVLTIAAVTRDTVSCTPDAPRVGDSYDESYKARNSAYLTERTISAFGFNNPRIRQLMDVQATLSYTAGAGSLVNLNTSSVSNSGTAANPAVTTGAWDGWVPVPMAGGMPNGPATGDPYVYNADGSINSVPKRPANGSKVALSTNLPAVQEYIPADWQRAIAMARDTAGTTAGSAVPGSWTITLRQTGGWLGRWNYSTGSFGSYGGATYLDVPYTVTAVFSSLVTIPLADPTVGYKGGAISASNPKQDSAGATITAANGKLTYGKFCQFTYTLTKVGGAGGNTQIASDATAWDNTSSAKTDIAPSCNFGQTCFSNWPGYGNGANAAAKVGNTVAESVGDVVGTFYTYDSLPRIVKDYSTAIGRASGGNAIQPSSSAIVRPMGNWAFYSNQTGNTNTSDSPGTGDTPPTRLDQIMTSVYRLAFP